METANLEIYEDDFPQQTEKLETIFGEDLTNMNKIEVLLSDIEGLYKI